ncbi:MAG: YitT family protein [Lachnospiraceae bacterium]|nr:YitT family protein [Lachnospiraceae bacterium]
MKTRNTKRTKTRLATKCKALLTKETLLSIGTDLLFEIFGSLFIALAIHNFAVSAGFPMTGFSGIAIILNRFFQIPIGLTTILLNIPVAILCYRLIGGRFLMKSFRCMVISSLFIDYVAPLFPSYAGMRLLAALVTGVLGGIGYAMIYTRGSSTGGADFLIMAFKSQKPHLRLGTIAFLIDVGIIIAGGLLFRDFDGILYGMIVNYLFAVMVDKVFYGLNSAKIAFIVTNQGKTICKTIEECSNRGSTILKSQGGYRMEEKQTVMVVSNSKEMYRILQEVAHKDQDAFIILLEAHEIHGNGFSVI